MGACGRTAGPRLKASGVHRLGALLLEFPVHPLLGTKIIERSALPAFFYGRLKRLAARVLDSRLDFRRSQQKIRRRFRKVLIFYLVIKLFQK